MKLIIGPNLANTLIPEKDEDTVANLGKYWDTVTNTWADRATGTWVTLDKIYLENIFYQFDNSNRL